MKYRIHWTHNDGTPDSVVVEGSTMEDVQKAANDALHSRGLDAKKNDAWSEEVA